MVYHLLYCGVLQQILCIRDLMLCALLFTRSLQEKLKTGREVGLSSLEQFKKSPGMS